MDSLCLSQPARFPILSRLEASLQTALQSTLDSQSILASRKIYEQQLFVHGNVPPTN
jgi:hypothetical protein